MLNQRSQIKNHILYDSVYMTCPKLAVHRGKNRLVLIYGWEEVRISGDS